MGAQQGDRASKDREAKQAALAVRVLTPTLPPDVVQAIYDDVVLELALRAGLKPKRPATPTDASPGSEVD